MLVIMLACLWTTQVSIQGSLAPAASLTVNTPRASIELYSVNYDPEPEGMPEELLLSFMATTLSPLNFKLSGDSRVSSALDTEQVTENKDELRAKSRTV